MQTFDCTVRLSGNVKMEVKKYKLPVSEIAVLQAVHGSDAVFNFSPTGPIRINSAREKERLVRLYGNRKEQAEKIEKLFPGLAPRLPATLGQLRGEETDADEPEEGAPEEPQAIDIPDEPAEGEPDVLDNENADFTFLNRGPQQGEPAAVEPAPVEPPAAPAAPRRRGRRSNAQKAAEAVAAAG